MPLFFAPIINTTFDDGSYNVFTHYKIPFLKTNSINIFRNVTNDYRRINITLGYHRLNISCINFSNGNLL